MSSEDIKSIVLKLTCDGVSSAVAAAAELALCLQLPTFAAKTKSDQTPTQRDLWSPL